MVSGTRVRRKYDAHCPTVWTKKCIYILSVAKYNPLRVSEKLIMINDFSLRKVRSAENSLMHLKIRISHLTNYLPAHTH